MAQPQYLIGDTFEIQFVWQLPNGGDYLRAIFKATVAEFDPEAEKYLVILSQMVAGRQESAAGEPREKEALSQAYWSLVRQLVGRKVLVAYEADDGRSLFMRLTTLTGEHSFFNRFN